MTTTQLVHQEDAKTRLVGVQVGLVLSAIALVPLLAFAVLWTALLVMIGGSWLLHALGLF
jgi:hypothetical protein